MRFLMNKDEWMERMWEEAFSNGSWCQGCRYLREDCGWYPFDVEPRLQEWVCERECEAPDPIDCPYVQEIVEELSGEIDHEG